MQIKYYNLKKFISYYIYNYNNIVININLSKIINNDSKGIIFYSIICRIKRSIFYDKYNKINNIYQTKLGFYRICDDITI